MWPRGPSKMEQRDLKGACLTAPGEGGLQVFRIEGEAVPALVRRIFRPSGKTGPDDRGLRHGHLHDGQHVVDEVVVHLEEDGRGLEISTHGGLGTRAAVQELLDREGVVSVDTANLASSGVWKREPGATVAREARRGLEGSWSVQSMLFHLAALEGRLVREVIGIRDSLVQARNGVVGGPAGSRLRSLLGRAPFGLSMCLPPALAIVGPPNVGKSTLLNALAGQDRCIVTSEPGTTRDLVTERAVLGGYAFEVLDTAGIRATEDPVERAGVDRALQAARDADLCLVVLDGTRSDDPGPELRALMARPGTLTVLNKTDLGLKRAPEILERDLGRRVTPVSALNGEGIDVLVDRVVFRSAFGGTWTRDLPAPFTARQVAWLEQALGALAGGPSEAIAALDRFLDEPEAAPDA